MYSRGNSYVQYLLLMITIHFTCHEKKIWSIKKVSKYYEHDCSLNVVQNNCSKNIRQTPQKKSVVEPTFHKFTCWELWYFQNDYFSEILWETTFKLLSGFKKLSTKSSRPKVFCKKGILGNFAKFCKISKNTFYTRTPLVAASDQPPVHQDLPFSVFAMPDNIL